MRARTFDTARAQQLIEQLLQAIAEHHATVVLIDITGVVVVDTLVAKSLLRAVAAAQMLGARCLLTGINPAVAQTLVRSGIGLEGVQTRGNLQSGLRHAFDLTGRAVTQRTSSR